MTAAAPNSPAFVHLRTHSEYSVSDSIAKVDGLAEAAAADRQVALALTDASNLFGWIKFYRAAQGNGVKPICGVDIWLSNKTEPDKPFRAVLLAKNHAGYLRICELVSKAWLENERRGRAEFEFSWFEKEANLIALSGAAAGDVGQALNAGKVKVAQALALAWNDKFPQSYYLEVQRDGSAAAEQLTRSTAGLASRAGLPLVATHPVQFLAPEEFQAHEARVCIAEGEILANPRRTKRFTADQYLKTQAQMVALFADLPSAISNSVAIAMRCSLTMTLGKSYLPNFPIPEGMELQDYLRQESETGLAKRMALLFPHPEERAKQMVTYQERLDYEIGMIVKMGFPGYFLIVADFINWAKTSGVPVGPGRGSGAGSLVAYALGITDINPLPYALLFERFLNPERVSMPDFDIDFCQDKRYMVIDYVRNKYGGQAVSQIVTFGTMASKAVIRDVGRVLDMPYNFCDQLSKLIPVVQNKPLSLEKAREAEPQFAERERNEDEVRGLLELAAPLEDLVRNVGMHAGGVLIAPGKLTDFCPLYKAPGTDSVVSQFDKDDVEAIGLVKFDFLGLRNLTIIDLAVQYVQQRWLREGKTEKLDLNLLSFDDPAAYDILKKANTTAIFQVEGEGMKKLLKKLAPDRFEDIIAVLALYRPGPLGSGMVDDFVLRKKGQAKIDYFHPDLQACLEPTYGVIVYQEQVMQISQLIGGYTLGGADLLRRAMGKKKAEEMAEHRDIFLKGAAQKNYDTKLAEQLFDLMSKFAEYGFNKSHTAAYAVVTYHTAWLKAHYPAEFMAATLSSDMDDTDKVQLFAKDTLAQNVKVLPPDINASSFRFEPVDPKQVRYGLGAVKGVGEGAVQSILVARQTKPFADLFDFCHRIDRKVVNRRSLEALIRAGAFDSLDVDRAKLLASLANALEAADQQAAHANQVSLFGAVEDQVAQSQYVVVKAWNDKQKLQEEKAALGFYFSGHLFSTYQAEVRQFVRQHLDDVQPSRDLQWLAGTVASMRSQMTRRGKMWIVVLDDGTAQFEVSVFQEVFERCRALLREDELVFVQAKVSNDEYSGGMRATVDDVMDIGRARAMHAKRLRIRLNGNADATLLRKALEPFSARHFGEQAQVPVVVTYENDAGVPCELRLGEGWRIKPQDELLAQLIQYAGPGAAVVEYA
jgi:DNA polymerase III subunit alpha